MPLKSLLLYLLYYLFSLFLIFMDVAHMAKPHKLYYVDTNFDKSTFGLHILLISSILRKFLKE